MYDLIEENKGLTDYLRKVPLPEEVRRPALELVETWELEPWEDALLWQFSFNSVTDIDGISSLQGILEIMRGEDDEATLPLSREELDGLQMDEPLLTDEKFQRRIMRTVYDLVHLGQTGDARRLLKCFTEFTDGTLVFAGLPAEVASFYGRICTILACNFFAATSDLVHLDLFKSSHLIKALNFGYKLEEAVKRYVELFLDIETRKEICLNLAAAILANDSQIGTDIEDKPMAFKDWLEKFRLFSNKKLTGIELMNFIQDKTYTGKLNPFEKEIVRKMIELYTHLVSGFLLVPEAKDASNIVAEASRIKFSDDTAPEVEEESAGPAVPDWRAVLSKTIAIGSPQALQIGSWISGQKDVSAAKRAVYEALANVDWRREPYLSNLLMLGEMLNQKFSGDESVLVYFDEQTNRFEFNK